MELKDERKCPTLLLKGFDTQEDKDNYKTAWARGGYLAKPIVEYIQEEIDSAINRLVLGEFQQLSQVQRVQADIKAYRKLLQVLPPVK